MLVALAYKILTTEQFIRLQRGQALNIPADMADGFVHLSTAEQVSETARRHFAGETDLVIAAVALSRLGDGLRWEVSRQGALFPHYYGQLGLAHVAAHAKLVWQDDAVVLPLPG